MINSYYNLQVINSRYTAAAYPGMQLHIVLQLHVHHVG